MDDKYAGYMQSALHEFNPQHVVGPVHRHGN